MGNTLFDHRLTPLAGMSQSYPVRLVLLLVARPQGRPGSYSVSKSTLLYHAHAVRSALCCITNLPESYLLATNVSDMNKAVLQIAERGEETRGRTLFSFPREAKHIALGLLLPSMRLCIY